MNRMSSSCRVNRENLCLLVADALSNQERASVKIHLAGCAQCREYHAEVHSVTCVITDWKKDFSALEPSNSAMARWARDFERTTISNSPASAGYLRWFLDLCRDAIWPSRRAWAGLAALWIVIIALNVSLRNHARLLAAGSNRPPTELVRVFLEHEGLLVGADQSSGGSLPKTRELE